MRLRILFFVLIQLSVVQSSWAQGHQHHSENERLPNDPNRSVTTTCLAPFYHGVASGDPLKDQVIIWTRVTTDSSTVDVKWRIATDTSMANIVNSGTVTTDATKDYTVKVDVAGLQPFTWYYYEFEAYGKYSVRGRTRTLPEGDIDSLRLAIVSCSQYTSGYFKAYEKITARNDVFAVVHLGDYIYEYGGGTAPRDHAPANEIITLSDYRMRHSQYKLDESLMRLHQQYPFFAVWDDHETANNSWYGGAENHTEGAEGNWFNRKAYGVQAYYEWMPLRMPDQQDTERIYRKFRIGNLIDLYMMDTRLEGREEQNGADADPDRTLLGSQQLEWFINGLDTSTAQWQIIGQQVMFAPLNVQPISLLPPIYPNDDQWDGYPAERQKIIDSVLVKNIDNFVVLTGDIHTSWANDIPTSSYDANTGAGSAGVEFVTTSVTSPGFPFSVGAGIIKGINDHMKYVDLTEHGYLLLDVNQSRTIGEWWYMDQISSSSPASESMAQAWYVNNGERFLRQYPVPTPANQTMIGIPAPYLPRGCGDSTFSNVDTKELATNSVLLGVYPNPFNRELGLQFTLSQSANTEIFVYDALGKQLFNKKLGTFEKGIYEKYVDLSALHAGVYILVLKIGNHLNQRKLIKLD